MRFFLFSLVLLLSACQTTKELDIWPLVYYDKDSEKQTTQLDILGSLYSQTTTAEKSTYALRPIFSAEIADKKTEVLFLWPFLRYTKKPNDSLISIIPFYYSRDIKRPLTGERDRDWFFLPFAAFGGDDTKEGSYLYLGFWGNIKGLLAYDEITGKPFPFYVTARDGEYFSKSYMWPFFRFGDGGGKKFRFYAFLYSYYEKKGKFIRRSYMWPFIHYNKEDLDKKNPRTEFMVFPLYGQSTSKNSLAWMFLWPLFSYSQNNDGYREYNLPWPFFKYRKGKGIDELRLWPLYWKNNQEDDYQKQQDLMLMWPIFWSLHTEYPTHTKDSLYVLPFYWQHWTKGKDKNAKTHTRLKIWPLLDYERKEDGSSHTRFLSPLWFDDYLPHGFEKTWLPLFTFFDYSQGQDNEKDFTFLGPIYKYQHDKDLTYHRFMFFSYKNKKKILGNEGRFSILGGLFEYNWQISRRGLRFFYLPTWPTWSK